MQANNTPAIMNLRAKLYYGLSAQSAEDEGASKEEIRLIMREPALVALNALTRASIQCYKDNGIMFNSSIADIRKKRIILADIILNAGE